MTTMVIDPSLFDTPVTKAVWKSVEGEPDASLTDSAASIYYLWGSITDPNYTETNYYLNIYRLQLQNRAIQYGPPPYTNCPVTGKTTPLLLWIHQFWMHTAV